jgi:hypothetical protein
VVDELGLRHGTCRADIAVINGLLHGFEIKSDGDELSRLPRQIPAYNGVFDRVGIIVGERHISQVLLTVPVWWSITLCKHGPKGGVRFMTVRKGSTNPGLELVSVARLLWRSEAVQLLTEKGESGKILRAPREVLYRRLADILSGDELRRAVRRFLKERSNWRDRGQLSRCGGLSRPIAK